MLRSLLHLGLVAALGLPAIATAAGAPTQVLKELPFETEVPKAVLDECNIQTKVPDFLAEFAAGSVVLVPELSGDKTLEMAITRVHAPGGGAFSGPKWMEVQGTLREGGEVRGTFRAKRFSTGGAFAGFKGTCAIIGRTTKAIGKDIAAWLNEPTMGAELGDAR